MKKKKLYVINAPTAIYGLQKLQVNSCGALVLEDAFF